MIWISMHFFLFLRQLIHTIRFFLIVSRFQNKCSVGIQNPHWALCAPRGAIPVSISKFSSIKVTAQLFPSPLNQKSPLPLILPSSLPTAVPCVQRSFAGRASRDCSHISQPTIFYQFCCNKCNGSAFPHLYILHWFIAFFGLQNVMRKNWDEYCINKHVCEYLKKKVLSNSSDKCYRLIPNLLTSWWHSFGRYVICTATGI
jgi:hypothetical protein